MCKLEDKILSGFKLLGKYSEPAKEVLKANRELDVLVKRGALLNEIREAFERCIYLNSGMFFAWLMDNGYHYAPEIFVELGWYLYSYFYCCRQRLVSRLVFSSLNKEQLKRFIFLVEFGVEQNEWDRGINPFNGCKLFFLYLKSIGYEMDNLDKLLSYLSKLQKKMDKKPYMFRGKLEYVQN